MFLFTISALLLTVIQAPVSWSFLAWAAYVPFAVACSPRVRPHTLALAAFAVGYLYWLGNLYWILPITILGSLGMALYLSLSWVLPALAVRFVRGKGIPLFLALPIIVVGWEHLQGRPMGGFFWRFLGHSQYANLSLIQIADLVGATGVSFVVAMVNGLLADLSPFVSRHKPCRVGLAPPETSDARALSGRVMLAGFAATVIVVAAAVGYGQWRLRQTPRHLQEGPLVAGLQSNVPQSVKGSFGQSREMFDELMGFSKAAAAAGAELIVWPETMVQAFLDPVLLRQLAGDFSEDQAFHQELLDHAKDTAWLLVGAHGAEVMWPAIGDPYVVTYNSAYFYRPDGTRDPGRYDKIHLVLFGEYIPFKRWFPGLFERFMPDGYHPSLSLEPGRHYTLFEMDPALAPRETTDVRLTTPGGIVKAEGLDEGVSPSKRGHELAPAQAGDARDTQEHRQAALDDATHRKTEDAGPASNPQSAIMSPSAQAGGRNPQSMDGPARHFAVIICYEDTIPYVGRNFALDEQGRKQIDWLVNISNDGWFVRFRQDPQRVLPSTELPQHAAICTFRAVENRLAIIRSVNTGISCLIESTGRIRDGYLAASDGFPGRAMDRTGLTGWFLDKMPIDTRVTFYSRHGEWFATGCAAAFVTALVWPLGARLIRRRKAA
ncbi:MAG: apolipoprotein N-acyltransferase [Planctomycetes bacterium RBG_13_62_9]|nr:MAG: apolipoprotein N-acyltransferase [Planctomycetes bacterium RBG_13_62_9]